MRTTDFIDHRREQAWYDDQIAHVERIGRQRAKYGWLRKPLPRPLDEALRRAGLSRFYRHQAREELLHGLHTLDEVGAVIVDPCARRRSTRWWRRSPKGGTTCWSPTGTASTTRRSAARRRQRGGGPARGQGTR